MMVALVTGLLYYCIAAVVLIWTGVGSCTGKRWVRPIVLIGSVASIYFGIGTVIGTLAVFLITSHTRSTPATSSSFFLMGILIAVGFEALVLLVLPSAMFWFYIKAQTREVLQSLDLTPRHWTDGIPVPLLGWAIAWFVFGLYAVDWRER